MAKVKGRYLILLITVLFLVCFGFYLFRIQNYRKNLRGVTYEALYLQDRENQYKLSNGSFYDNLGKKVISPLKLYQLYSLASFSITQEEDPLFISPGFERKKYDLAISNLREENNKLKQGLSTDDNFVPINFLEEISNLSVSVSKFEKRRSRENAEILIAAYERTTAVYKSDAKDLINAISSTSIDKKTAIQSLGSTFTPELVLSDLDLITKNSESLNKEINRRQRILSGMLLSSGPKFVSGENMPPSNSTSLLSDKELNLDSRTAERVGGPYYMKTGCFNQKEEVRPFYLTQKNLNSFPVITPKLADESYFQKLTPSAPNDLKYLKKGIEYQFIHEGNNYRCNDLEYQARLMTLHSFISDSGYKPILREIDSALDRSISISESYIKEEEAFFSRRGGLGDKELTAVTKNYFEVYLKLKSSVERSERLNEYQKEILERYLYLQNHGSSVNNIFNSTLYLNNINNRIKNKVFAAHRKNTESLMIHRSSYSLSFLNFSPSTWRLQEKCSYLVRGKESLALDERYLTLTEAKSRFSPEEISSWYLITESDLIAPVN